MKVGELENREVVFATPDEDLVTAARRMREMHVGSLVVVEEQPDGRYPVGIVTDRDLIVAVVAHDLGHARALAVSDVMSAPPTTAREEDDVSDAVRTMRRRGVRRLPVVDRDGRLSGILAFDDLVEWVAEQLGDLVRLIAREQRRERETRSP